VAPPERSAHSPTASFLPPAPTISSSRARVDREPKITSKYTAHRDLSEEESDVGSDDKANAVASAKSSKGARVGRSSAARVLTDSPCSAPASDIGSDDNDSAVASNKHFGPPTGARVGPPKGPPKAARVVIPTDMDISNLPPLEREPPANGSSRATGGIFRGRALGNSFNIGDEHDDMQEDVMPLIRGRVNITIVKQPPGDLVIENPSSYLKVNSPCYETLGPVLKKVAKSYSPVRSK